ncbi:MAG: hypothetical protein ACREVV_16725 [Steroidobacteraceae bacterium]
MSRIEALEARRRALLNRCEEQRLELAYRVAQIRPAAQLTAWKSRGGPRAAANHPLAWIAGLATLLLMFRTRRLLTGVTWITGLVALASRATTLLRIFAQLRAVYVSMKATRRPSGRAR